MYNFEQGKNARGNLSESLHPPPPRLSLLWLIIYALVLFNRVYMNEQPLHEFTHSFPTDSKGSFVITSCISLNPVQLTKVVICIAVNESPYEALSMIKNT